MINDHVQSLVKFDRGLATKGASGGAVSERLVISPHWVPVTQIVLLTLKVRSNSESPCLKKKSLLLIAILREICVLFYAGCKRESIVSGREVLIDQHIHW